MHPLVDVGHEGIELVVGERLLAAGAGVLGGAGVLLGVAVLAVVEVVARRLERVEGGAVLPDALVQRVAFVGAVAPVGLPGEVVAAVQGLGVGDVQTDAGELDHRGGVRAPRVSAQHRQPSLLRGVRRNLDHEEISRKQ